MTLRAITKLSVRTPLIADIETQLGFTIPWIVDHLLIRSLRPIISFSPVSLW